MSLWPVDLLSKESSMMIRRLATGFILLLVMVSTDVSVLCAEQQFVASVITGDLQRYRSAHDAFIKILRAGGMGEDKVKVYVQNPNPDAMSWANSIRKAVGGGADLIITYGAPVTLIAKKEAKGIPLLFADVYDPVALGIVKDLAATGGEISGIASTTPVETLARTLVDIQAPKTILALFSSSEQGSLLQEKRMEEQGKKLGFSVTKYDVKSRDAAKQAIRDANGKADAVYITESVLLTQGLQDLIKTATENRLPVVTQIPEAGEKGALLTLEADPIEQGQLLAVHALQVLGGQKVFTLPVRTPKKVALVVNMKVAEELGMKIPFQALSLATRVIK
jgi:putative ABC transport system substrate-binding protein